MKNIKVFLIDDHIVLREGLAALINNQTDLEVVGQVGDGTTVNRRVPTAVSGLSAGVAQVMAGGAHSCVRLTVGTLRCWGTNGSGQLGDGTLVARKVPVAVTGVTGAAGLALGSSHTLVRIDGTGGLRSWGRGSSGQLGTGVTATRAVAGTVVGLG